MIRILLADDQRLMCDGLKSMLEANADFSVAGMAYDGKQAIALAEKLVPDLVLLDIRMPEMDGVEAVLHLKQKLPQLKVVMLTTFNDEEYILAAMANGADGYLLKDMDTAALQNAVQNTMSGQLVMPMTVAENLKKGLTKIKRNKEAQNALAALGLSARETEIAKMVADGFSNSQIATALYLSNGTVRNYVSTLYEKLVAKDKANAIVKLKDMGL
jgi:DNA-binding NarL/FixJ family response regulator